MKSQLLKLLVGATAVSFLVAGCGKQEASAPAAPAANTAPAAADMKAVAAKAAEQTKQAATEMTANLSAQAQGMIDKAKGLIGEKKYQEAITSLQQVAASKITPEQKKVVDDLIAQAQKLMSSDMGKAVQGVMKK